MSETTPVTNPLDQEELFRRGREIVLAAPQLYIDVDVEADGIPGFGSMLALAGLSPTGESFYSEVKPTTELFIPSQRDFCEAHGLERERLLAEAPEAKDVIMEFHDWVTGLGDYYRKRPVLTAWGPDLDAGFVKLYYAQAGMLEAYPFRQQPLDLKSLALPLVENWDWSKTRKMNLPPELIPPGDFTHFAPEDVAYQQQIHFGMAAVLGAGAYLQTSGTRPQRT